MINFDQWINISIFTHSYSCCSTFACILVGYIGLFFFSFFNYIYPWSYFNRSLTSQDNSSSVRLFISYNSLLNSFCICTIRKCLSLTSYIYKESTIVFWIMFWQELITSTVEELISFRSSWSKVCLSNFLLFSNYYVVFLLTFT